MNAPFLTKSRANAQRAPENARMLSNVLPISKNVPGPKLSPQAQRAMDLYAARRKRAAFLPELSEYFHEPVWDMLLDLFVAGERGDVVSVTSACIGTIPATTALRIIAALEEREVVVLEPDPSDKRRRFVKLSAETKRQMTEYLSHN